LNSSEIQPACERSSMEEFGRDCCVRSYHVYKEIWEAAAGEVLECVSRTTFKMVTGVCQGFAEWW